jgi:uncharacterized protein (TIGR03435 family)
MPGMRLAKAFVVLASAAAFGQTASLRFEVASIRMSQPGPPFDVVQAMQGGATRCTHVTFHTLIRWAYRLDDHQLQGGPAWLDSDRFDIVAKPQSFATRDEVELMVQALLADRCKLSFHRDTKDVTGYEIVVGKNGPKLQAADGDSRPNAEMGMGFVTAKKMQIQFLAKALAHRLNCPVVDKTALKGDFDYKLEWAPERHSQNPEAEPALTVFTAIEEQLGLKLEARRFPLETLVIDHIEKPSEN